MPKVVVPPNAYGLTDADLATVRTSMMEIIESESEDRTKIAAGRLLFHMFGQVVRYSAGAEERSSKPHQEDGPREKLQRLRVYNGA